VSKKIVDVLLEKGGDFVHGYTYSGHPTCAAVALANIEILENEGLVERTRNVTGPYLARALKRLDNHPLVGEARSVGLIGAVEIVSEKGTNKRFTGKEGTAGPIVRDLCIRNGLMVRGIRDSIVMCPPLIITEAEIDQIVDTIEKALNEAEPVLRAL
jgi:putrescine aminotransferase